MPVQIGAVKHNFNDPTRLLSDCHRRVEMFLGILHAVGKRIDQLPTEETTQALESALRYFAEAAPKHTADEEESLFPRLRRVDDPDLRSALVKMDKLEDDHRWAAPLHAEIERIGAQYLSASKLSDGDVVAFRNSVESLVAMYRQHISIEDELIFPLAARVLSDAAKSAIAREMADRRHVKLVAELSPGRQQK